LQIIQIDPSNKEDTEFWQVHNPTIFSMAQKSPEGKAIAHVCQNFMCNPPISDPVTLEQLLRQPPKLPTYKMGVSSKQWLIPFYLCSEFIFGLTKSSVWWMQNVCIVTDISAVYQEYLYRTCSLCVFYINAHASNWILCCSF